jgi:hypothetical protein
MSLLLLSLSLSTAEAAPEIDTRLVELQDVQVGLGGASFTAMVELTRRSGPPLVLKEVTYQLLVDGQPVGSATTEKRSTRLKKDQPTLIDIPGQIGASAGMSVIQAAARGRIEVKVVGEAKARVFIFPVTVPFETEVLRYD